MWSGTPGARSSDLLAGQVDLVVIARYMRIPSANVLDRVGVPAINIHHFFLRPSREPSPATAPTIAASS